jgi:hypothetical protein
LGLLRSNFLSSPPTLASQTPQTPKTLLQEKDGVLGQLTSMAAPPSMVVAWVWPPRPAAAGVRSAHRWREASVVGVEVARPAHDGLVAAEDSPR